MALELHRAGRAFGFLAVSAGWAFDLQILVDDDAVVAEGERCWRLLSIVDHRVGELGVVGLPGERGEAHVHVRRGVFIDAATFVIQAFESEAIEDLHFVVVDLIKAGIAPALTAGGGAIGQHELHMHVVVVVFFCGADVASVGVEKFGGVVDATAGKVIFAAAVEQDRGAFWGLFAEGFAFAHDFGECGVAIEGEPLAGERADMLFMTNGRELLGGGEAMGGFIEVPPRAFRRTERDHIFGEFSDQEGAVFSVPAVSRQSAWIDDDLKFARAQCNHLRADIWSAVLTLQGKVCRDVVGCRVGPDFGLIRGRKEEETWNEKEEGECNVHFIF